MTKLTKPAPKKGANQKESFKTPEPIIISELLTHPVGTPLSFHANKRSK